MRDSLGLRLVCGIFAVFFTDPFTVRIGAESEAGEKINFFIPIQFFFSVAVVFWWTEPRSQTYAGGEEVGNVAAICRLNGATVGTRGRPSILEFDVNGLAFCTGKNPNQ